MKIILIAHDKKKSSLIKILKKYKNELNNHTLLSTLHTGQQIKKELNLNVTCFKSGINGGDVQLAKVISLEKIDCVIFLIDSKIKHPHKKDIDFFLKTCKSNNIVVAKKLNSAKNILDLIFEK